MTDIQIQKLKADIEARQHQLDNWPAIKPLNRDERRTLNATGAMPERFNDFEAKSRELNHLKKRLNNTPRKPGFYSVVFNGVKEVAELSEVGCWFRTGSELEFRESDFTYISPEPIEL